MNEMHENPKSSETEPEIEVESEVEVESEIETEPVAGEEGEDGAEEGEAEAVKTTPAQELYDWMEVLVIAVAVVMLIFTFIGRVATVDGGSMLPTLTHGERLLVQEIAYKPEQGDIIICQSKSYGFEEPLVKRIIALSGQTVMVDFENWKVYVDGVELQEDYINYTPGVWMNGWDYGESYTVPEGYVFVMGDNRNNSQDSRRTHVGPIDERLILGKAVVGFSARDGIRFFE